MSFQNDNPKKSKREAISRARRRRSHRRIVPQGKNSRVHFLDQLARQATPSLTDFVIVVVAAIMAAIALITDAPAFYLLAVLIAPFMASMIGLALGTLVGSWRFFLQSLVGMLVSLLVFFGGGIIAGLLVDGAEPGNFVMAHHLAFVSVADLLLLTFGAVFTIQQLAKHPEQRPRLISAALAYELLLPAAVTGFGLTSGIEGLGSSAGITLLVHLSWSILVGAVTLAVLGLRPNGWFGYALTGGIIVIAFVSAIVINGSIQLPQMPSLEAASIPTIRPTSSEPTATKTEFPTETPDETLLVDEATQQPTLTRTPLPPSPTATSVPATQTNTPAPTTTNTPENTPEPRLAIIDAAEGNGAIFRTGPYISAETVEEPYTTLLNGIYVKLYETVSNEDGEWGHIRLVSDDSIEGWVLLSLLSIEN